MSTCCQRIQISRTFHFSKEAIHSCLQNGSRIQPEPEIKNKKQIKLWASNIFFKKESIENLSETLLLCLNPGFKVWKPNYFFNCLQSSFNFSFQVLFHGRKTKPSSLTKQNINFFSWHCCHHIFKRKHTHTQTHTLQMPV